ncbi:SMI1/KNR4 family protein [Tepidibacter aestuarii]|uniref:SMI1/KNR4 family protein n=1 Tax=Tepidibacter aestuarii TaxID=2925782 RepID=UPI0020BF73D6|nr:SMI1/KNR4 family protein [Tepidibacter aestuarii]CAH2213863.1 protein of unknown function [Tepidibacter aestuarii]
MWDKWTERWEKTLEAVQSLNGDIRKFKICKPASQNEVEEVEKKLGFKLPISFRKVLLEFSSSVNFEWYLPDNIELPQELREIFSGDCSWNINLICELEKTRKDWITQCFPDINDDYDKIWHNKLGFMNVPNGDMIAFDLKEYPERTPIVYLSHDDGEGHGYILGEDFIIL